LTNGNNERVRITSDGQVRIGSFGSASNKNSVTPLSHVDGSGVNGGFQVNRHTSVGGGGAQLMLTATRGSGISSHTVLQDNDGIGTLVFAGSDGGEFVTGAEIQAVVDGTPGDDDLPTELIFRTNSGGGSATDAMRISAGADLLLGGHSARTYDDTGDSNTILDIYNSTANKRGILSLSGNTNGSSSIGTIWFNNDYNSSSSPGSTMKLSAAIQAQGVTSDSNAGDDAGAILQFLTKPEAGSLAERMRIDSAGRLMVGKTTAGVANDGAELRTGVSDYAVVATAGGHIPMIINRNTDDGGLLRFRQANTDEGTVSVSGGTVTYGQFCGSHWGRLEDNSKPEILPGTILETINKAVEWKVIEFTVDGEQKRQAYNGSEENGASVTVEYEGVSYTGTVADEEPDSENLNKHVCVKVSDTAASKAVFGVFLGWDTDESDNIIGTWNDMNIAAIGNYFIRIKSGQSLEIGDLIESDGTGCGVVQSDDIIRSKTVAKVTSTTSHQVYADGSFLVTCVLYSG
jgi:hypothetical protein